MTSSQMPRRKVTYRLDDRILDELEKLVTDGSVNQFVEGVLFEFLKNTGRLSITAQRLPDNRGGKRSGAGKPKRSEIADTPIDRVRDILD
jgi:hypothetical protein